MTTSQHTARIGFFGVARDRFATPASATASQGSGARENDG